MEKYYNAGYYLIKTKPLDFGIDRGKIVCTCSGCINLSVWDNWCLSWMNEPLDKSIKLELRLNSKTIKAIQEWTDSRFETEANVFPDLATALEFKQLFLTDIKDIAVYGLYFSATEANQLINEFAEGKNTNDINYNNGNLGLRRNLIRQVAAKEDTKETVLGYDFIGVEYDGSFHSFHCHSITSELIERFSLTLNANGLFDKPDNTAAIKTYFNDPDTGFAPVPWYIVMVKQYDDNL